MHVLFALAAVVASVNCHKYFETEQFKPCPRVNPVQDLNIKELQGSWHVSLIILDAATENLEESTVCITGDIIAFNTTHMKQTWNMYTPRMPNEPIGNIEFNVDVIKPGLWAVETPLGGELAATIFSYDNDLILVTHCGWQNGHLVHLWTAGASRKNNSLNLTMRIKISSILLANGFDPSTTKIITWNNSC
ncbi:uncharacterized protein LOC106664840 [Cimex lectularius]|uniref:Uncharacterized protein n=1 Tax=Cimex lectularius TaxID=79782 RepID=A0A8I6RJ77_CIMLE|nr:uncharacterized protein LOC106664840 [Cimex lectularius]